MHAHSSSVALISAACHQLLKRNLFVVALIFLVAPAMAQVKHLSQVGQRLGPPNFGPAGGLNCSFPVASIPDADPVGVTDTLHTVVWPGPIFDLSVVIQATHTWVGDLQFQLTHDDTGTSAILIDRPGYTGTGFGCSGDDLDVHLNDWNSHSVEDECEAQVPTIQGDLSPFPDALAVFNGEEFVGDWTMRVIDNAGGDIGTLEYWCVDVPSVDDSDPPDVPATSPWGVIALVALFMSVSLFYLRRRGGAEPS